MLNLFADEWDGGRDRPGWQWQRLDVGKRLGSKHIGASLYELAPGQKTFPYHWEVKEEWLIVLGGEPTLRTPDGEQRLAPGDVAVFKVGPEGAHAVRNDTAEPVRLLMLSSDKGALGEVAFYPDSGKIGVFAPTFGVRKILDESAELDYFLNEDEIKP
jgi:uncharacterized cupin superfamily protein